MRWPVVQGFKGNEKFHAGRETGPAVPETVAYMILTSQTETFNSLDLTSRRPFL